MCAELQRQFQASGMLEGNTSFASIYQSNKREALGTLALGQLSNKQKSPAYAGLPYIQRHAVPYLHILFQVFIKNRTRMKRNKLCMCAELQRQFKPSVN